MCVKVEYLPDVAKGIKDSQVYRDIKDGLAKVLSQLKEETTKRRENLSSLEQGKETLERQITKLEEDLKKKISEMAQNARAELQTKYDDIGKTLEEQISNLEKMILLITSGEEKLKHGNDMELFVKVKGGQNIIKDAQKLLSMSKTKRNTSFSFQPSDELQQLARALNSLGTIRLNGEQSKETLVDVRKYMAQLSGKYNVNEGDCRVTAVCILDDTALLIFVSSSNYLKRLNMTDFKVVDQLRMEDSAFSICNVGSQEVAVALYNNRKIQYVSVAGTMTRTRSFSTDHLCFGMAFNESTGELCVSNNKAQVKVYDKKGNVLKSLVNDGTGKPLFSIARQIVYSDDNNTMFISDWRKGLLAMDKSLSVQWLFSYSELNGASGLCVLPGGVTLVSGYESRNVVQVDKQGKTVGTLLGAGENLNNIWALAYNRKLSTLIVGQNSNEIHVYRLTPK